MIPGKYEGGTPGLCGEAASARRGPVCGTGGGEGAKMAGPTLAFGPKLGRAAGSAAAWERRRCPLSSRAAAGSAGRVAGFLFPYAVQGSFLQLRLGASTSCSGQYPLPIDFKFTFFGVPAPSPRDFFFFLS